jgi:hypothetical protein
MWVLWASDWQKRLAIAERGTPSLFEPDVRILAERIAGDAVGGRLDAEIPMSTDNYELTRIAWRRGQIPSRCKNPIRTTPWAGGVRPALLHTIVRGTPCLWCRDLPRYLATACQLAIRDPCAVVPSTAAKASSESARVRS